MTAAELVKMIGSGLRPVVTFSEGVLDKEGYAEAKMRARIVGASADSDGMVKLKFSFVEFADFNLPFESANYYDKNHRPVLTAREAGFYKDEDVYYFDKDEKIKDVMSLESDRRLDVYMSYQSSGEERGGASYIQWLEDRLLELGFEPSVTDTPEHNTNRKVSP
jgi:hypothetical protein